MPVHPPGRVFTDLAVAVADGADAIGGNLEVEQGDAARDGAHGVRDRDGGVDVQTQDRQRQPDKPSCPHRPDSHHMGPSASDSCRATRTRSAPGHFKAAVITWPEGSRLILRKSWRG